MSDATNPYEFGIFWLALAIVTAGLAESKGRRRWTWFVLALFIGPLATALVVCWPRTVLLSRRQSAGEPQ